MRTNSIATWLLVTAWWLVSGLVWTSQVVTMYAAEGRAAPVADVLLRQLSSAMLWVPITMALLWCVQRWPVERGYVRRALALQLLAVFGVIVLRALAVAVLDPVVGWYAQAPTWPELLRDSTLNNFLASWTIIAVAHALVFAARERRREQQAAELEGMLARARLDSLSAQLNPHFLFNALNSIAELVHADPDAADRMLVNLGTLLRHSLDRAGTQEVPLREELELLSHYVDIEQVRLGPRLAYACSVAPDALDARVPHLILQPLVENAVRHAVAPRAAAGAIQVSVERRDDRLLLQVADDGDGTPALPGAGVGLRNTRARLQALYGADHRFELRPRAGGGTIAWLELPFRGAVVAA